MTPQRIAAFSDGQNGGNPAGVVIQDQLPSAQQMQAMAKDIGYSETVFAAPQGDRWKTRYYSPETEVEFCGHATIALGVALGEKFGAGNFELDLSNNQISVAANKSDQVWTAELKSPKTRSQPLVPDLLHQLLVLFDLQNDQLDPQLPPTLAFAGVHHAIIALKDRSDLAAMSYDFDTGRKQMQQNDLTTITLLHIENETKFASRNAFAIGGVVEDPATGAAAAALGGALVDLDWPALRGGGTFVIRQGQDMGQPSILNVTVSGTPGDSVSVRGTARKI